MLSRRSMLIALPTALGCQGLLGTLRASVAGGVKRVAVAFPSALAPCTEAVEGLRLRLSGNEVALDLLDVNQATFAGDAAGLPNTPENRPLRAACGAAAASWRSISTNIIWVAFITWAP